MSSGPVHPRESDKPVYRQHLKERRARRRQAQLRKLDRNMRDEEAAQRRERQMVLGEEQ